MTHHETTATGRPADPTRTCACWGPLGEHEMWHHDCAVTITDPSQQVAEHRVGPYPRVCTCECSTCKRAWWAAGRPRTTP